MTIKFVCHDVLPQRPEEIAAQILDPAKWPDFQGYGPLPGIKAATFEIRTPDVVGSRIRVENLDGSRHVEVITEWRPEERLQLSMQEFSPPVSRLATRFVETWDLHWTDDGTAVTRSFEMHPKSVATWPVLWLVSFLLKRAIARHLRQLATQATSRSL